MFIGHFAPAFAAAAISPRAPRLGTLFVAGQLVDWGFFTFAALGLEKMRIEPGATAMVPFDLYYMPFTHSLLGSAVWALVFGLIVTAWLKDAKAGTIAALVVLSHWLLDLLTHRPDLTLAGGPAAYGLGLWNYPALAMPFELLITLGAFWWYMRQTRGPVGPPLVLLVVLLALQAANWFAPIPRAVSQGLYLQALAAYAIATLLARWVGTNRRLRRPRD